MARANRHFIPGHIWHLTHRCHKREFLLESSKDRQGWMQWLYEAKTGMPGKKHCHCESVACRGSSNQTDGFAIGRQIRQGAECFEWREPQSSYNALFEVEKRNINSLTWFDPDATLVPQAMFARSSHPASVRRLVKQVAIQSPGAMGAGIGQGGFVGSLLDAQMTPLSRKLLAWASWQESMATK